MSYKTNPVPFAMIIYTQLCNSPPVSKPVILSHLALAGAAPCTLATPGLRHVPRVSLSSDLTLVCTPRAGGQALRTVSGLTASSDITVSGTSRTTGTIRGQLRVGAGLRRTVQRPTVNLAVLE